MALKPLTCTGKDGVSRTFYYGYDPPNKTDAVWHFRVHLHDPPQSDTDDFFDMVLAPLGQNSVYVSMIEHHSLPWYRSKGIPDALIPEAARVLGKTVFSSQSAKRSPSKDQYRTVCAEKMWKRLTTKGLARYDPREDRYLHPPNGQP